jgi:hypothetical protein
VPAAPKESWLGIGIFILTCGKILGAGGGPKVKNDIRVSAISCLACVLFSSAQVARADVIEPKPILPPTVGGYVLPNACITATPTPFCLTNTSFTNFQITSDTISGGNEVVFTTALFQTTGFLDINGNLGPKIGSLSTTGTVDFIFFGRSSATELGTFSAQITNFDFMGSLGGNKFEAMQDSSTASTGSATISSVSGSLDGPFDVSSFFDIFADVDINGNSFGIGPRVATLTTPEPSSSALLLTCVVGLAAAGYFRRRSRRAA